MQTFNDSLTITEMPKFMAGWCKEDVCYDNDDKDGGEEDDNNKEEDGNDVGF